LKAFIPKRLFTTDNAAMVAVAGYFKYLNKDFCDISLPPFARVTV
ncbi:MAG: tRNA (adenosine(37)-N6)-threonylcarbamoyltransferase complex transferase subunit TsaD, partial [Muribaculaceae bacterium]